MGDELIMWEKVEDCGNDHCAFLWHCYTLSVLTVVVVMMLLWVHLSAVLAATMIYGFAASASTSFGLYYTGNWNGQIFIYSICLRALSPLSPWCYFLLYQKVYRHPLSIWTTFNATTNQKAASRMFAWVDNSLTFSGKKNQFLVVDHFLLTLWHRLICNRLAVYWLS